MAERNSTPCFIKLLAAERGVRCHKDCSGSVNIYQCSPLSKKGLFSEPIPVLLETKEPVSVSSPTILDLIAGSTPHIMVRDPVEVKTVEELMG